MSMTGMHWAFLVGRSCLAQVRPMTVPRLELCAAVLAIQLKHSMMEEVYIPVTKSTFWSDSACMLQYIIHELLTPYQCRNVPSELNPADEVSRGLTVQDMIDNSKWLNGPMFLHKKEESCPSESHKCSKRTVR